MIRGVLKISFVIGVLAVTWLSLTPKAALPSTEVWDKLIHLVAYAALGLSGGLGFSGPRFWLLIGVGLITLGCLLEVAQIDVSGRSASIADAFANGIGIVVGLVAAWAGNLLLSRYERGLS
jgi:VanZ family protein